MSIKDLFKNNKILTNATVNSVGSEAESQEYVSAYVEDKERYIPTVDFSNPAEFCFYGNCEKYYEDSIKRIYNQYPFDGSSKEKLEFWNSSSYLDRYIFDNEYPRTNGFARFCVNGWGTKVLTSNELFVQPPSASLEWITIKGGPHNVLTGSKTGANKYKSSKHRESNLRFGGDRGNTVEFWLNTGEIGNAHGKSVIFDLWNGETPSYGVGSQYGRFTVYITGSTEPNTVFYVTCVSGTVSAGVDTAVGLNDGTVSTSSVMSNTWNHYAISTQNHGFDLLVSLYKNGELNDITTVSNGAINEITGSLIANIGALRTKSSPTESPPAAEGWGKLSGSVDEFRFWKSVRTSRDIGRYWKSQVHGGTNTDDANVELGVYYKFNEGTVGSGSIDSTVLDYSGRLSHGWWQGYASGARATGSAMVISGKVAFEHKDPIIYLEHKDVYTLLSNKRSTGSYYDLNNNASIYNSFPAWIIEEDQDREANHLLNLTQIISSYFDTLQLQIKSLVSLKNANYISSSSKPLPFADRLLSSMGFVTPEIFADADIISHLVQKDEKVELEQKLHDVRNLIYQNIYNNLTYIYKSKGTEKSLRNLIRCFGVDDELVRINLYADNITHEFKDNYRYTTVKKNYIDFNNTGSFSATVYQYTASSNTDSVSILSASSQKYEKTGYAQTYECEVVFPKKFDHRSELYFETPFITSSLMGVHTALTGDYDNTAWNLASRIGATSGDVANFQIYAVRDKLESNDVYFKLTGSSEGYFPVLTSSLFRDVYNNEKWNLAVRIAPTKYPYVNAISGTYGGTYNIEFYGVNTILDKVQNEFAVSGTINTSQATDFLTNLKRFYIGAHRTDFTGSVLQQSDVKISSARVWATHLSNDEVKAHAIDPTNYGTLHPLDSIHLFQHNLSGSSTGSFLPSANALMLHWDFAKVTGSDASSQFYVDDLSSGSSTTQQRYGWLGPIINRQHTGRGDFFPASYSNIVDKEYIFGAKQKLPEILDSSDMIEILEQDDVVFTRSSRPIKHYFSVEKSMYQTISDEMIDIFATIKEFNNLVGEPVHRYRQSYKGLEKLRGMFFEKVSNTPDIEKYIDFYKWIDSSLGKMLLQLVPASANISEGIMNVIESHILERNKYWSKLPRIEHKIDDPESGMKGINELTYDWEHGHYPESGKQRENRLYWQQKALRSDSPLSTGDATFDEGRNRLLSASLQTFNRKLTTPYKLVVTQNKVFKRNKNKVSPQYILNSTRFGNPTQNFVYIPSSSVLEPIDNTDDLGLNKKKTMIGKAVNAYDGTTQNSDLVLPFNMVSSSVNTGYQSQLNSFKDDVAIVNLHRDVYGNEKDPPLQGPFTEQHVGGLQYRHIGLNTGSVLNNETNRPEGWRIFLSNNELRVESPENIASLTSDVNIARAQYYRDEVAKRPVNIKNIINQNYRKTYEVVHTTGRRENNQAFVENNGFTSSVGTSIMLVPSLILSGTSDYTKPTRAKSGHVFVSRFSAPGDKLTSGDSNGGQGLDLESAEYSPYNSLNYRNPFIRRSLNTASARHCGPFGYDSQLGRVQSHTYEGTASFHKIYRNRLERPKQSGSSDSLVTASVFDNLFIQHAIPRNEFNYSWISSSYYLLPYGFSTGSGDITFISASSNGSALIGGTRYYDIDAQELSLYSATDFIPDNFTFLNYHIYENITASNHLLGFGGNVNWNNINNGFYNTNIIDGFFSVGSLSVPNRFTYLNTLLNKRNGPYGWSSWKQIRAGETPLARYLKKNNIITIIEKPQPLIVSVAGGQQTVVEKRGSKLVSYTEPSITSKYKPIVHQFVVSGENNKEENITIKYPYAGEISSFANEDLSNRVKLNNKLTIYDKLVNNYINRSVEDINNPINKFNFLKYSETVFPREQNTYLSKIRQRENYSFDIWNENRGQRHQTNVQNSQGFMVNQSKWALDGRNNYETADVVTGSSGGEGELQNSYTTFFGGNPDYNEQPSLPGNTNPAVVRFNFISESNARTQNPSAQTLGINYYKEGVYIGTGNSFFGSQGSTFPNDFTVSAWINFTSSFSGSTSQQPPRQTILSMGADNYAFYIETGSLINTRFLGFTGSNNSQWRTQTEINDGTWYHVAAVVDLANAMATRVKFYVNGSEFASDIFGPGTGSVTITSTGSCIATSSYSSYPYEGYMSDFSLLSGGMSATQITELYNSGYPKSLYLLSRTASMWDHWYRLGGGFGTANNRFGATIIYRLFGKQTRIPDSVNGTGKEPLLYANYGFNYPNRFWNMFASSSVRYSIPLNNMNNDDFVKQHTLLGEADHRENGWTDSFKVGALYARRTIEYLSTPWIRKPILTSDVDPVYNIEIRLTGSKIFAGDTKWSAPDESGKKPFYESYNDYNNDLKSIGKDYSIIPEFRISEHMENYVDQQGGNFYSDNDGFLILTGSSIDNSSQNDFYKTYSHTDFMKYFDIINNDHKDIGKIDEIKLSCKALLKFLPYEGFYPQDRTLQLATLFSQSYGDYVLPRGYGDNSASTASWRAFISPFFAPGILYNSIKSGMAVDFPIYHGNIPPNIMEDYKSGVGGEDALRHALSPHSETSRTSRGIYGIPTHARASQWISNGEDTTIFGEDDLLLLGNSVYNIIGVNPTGSDDKAEWQTVLASPFSSRIPFEGLISPENYISKKPIWDMEPDHSASLRTRFNDETTNQAAFWGGRGSQKYKLAMHNFLAETPDFFLENENFTTFVSKPISQEGIVIKEEDSKSFFGMDITVYNGQIKSLSDYHERRSSKEFSYLDSKTFKVSSSDWDDLKGTHTKMYDRDSAYGPPWIFPHHYFTASNTIVSHHHSYEPFTPSYFNGYGSARLLFYPYKGAGKYTIDEIQSHLTASYTRMPTERNGVCGVYLTDNILDWTTLAHLDKNTFKTSIKKNLVFDGIFGSNGTVYNHKNGVDDVVSTFISASNNWMMLSASINLLGKTKIKKVIYEKGKTEEYEPVSVEDDPSNSEIVWSIQPKWETPILNFKNKIPTAPSENSGTGSLSRGMWHQYGDIITGSEGIYFSINDIPDSKLTSEGKSAITVTNTDIQQKAIGSWFNRSENLVELEKQNAKAIVYIGDYLQLGGATIIIDGTSLTGNSDFNINTNNFATALNLANAINNTTNSTVGASNPGGIPLYQRVSASARLVYENNPFSETNVVTGSTIAVVDIIFINTLDFSIENIISDPFYKENYTADPSGIISPSSGSVMSYPDYYAAGVLGNQRIISIEAGSTDFWILEGADENGNKTTGHNVYFAGGSSPKYEVKSMADLLGFDKTPKKLGRIADEKVIKEAVVAVPFVEVNGDKRFFSISKREIDLALNKRQKKENEKQVGDTIIDMVEKMKKYVFPPKMDFIKNKNTRPFAMYIFEFEHKLTKQDLADIWQNLQPEIGVKVEQKEVSISHKLLSNELLKGTFSDKLQWMVFKVKEKAQWNYFAKTADSSDDDRFKFNFNIGGGRGASKAVEPDYSYNWPYDFFSLVELVKMDATLTIKDKKDVEDE